MDAREIRRDITGAERGHRRLLELLDARLADATLDPAAPSRLPGWTVGHVLTHVARNADGIVRAIEGANRGEMVARYAGGTTQRNADIEAGAGRPGAQLVADVRSSAARLEATWSDDVAWDGRIQEGRGERPVATLPFLRWREVVVHTVDLGLGAEIAEWPDDYVRLDLRRLTMRWNARRPMGLTGLPPEALALDPRTRLAWLLGRVTVEGLPPPPPF